MMISETVRQVRALKRIMAWMIVLLMVFIGIPCSAESGIYCEYVPKTENSTVFYIDVFSTVDVSAAVMDLSFDETFVEYREVSAAQKSSTVRSAKENGLVKIALADSGTINGKLCRVAFKAIQTGTCTFHLHISQATDGDPKMLGGFSDYSLEVKLGKDDVASGSASKASSKVSSSASSKADKNGSSSRSYIKNGSDSDEYIDPDTGEVIDLRKNHALKYILIGAGIVVLIAALIFAGIMIGRKTSKEQKETASEKSPNPENSVEDPPIKSEDYSESEPHDEDPPTNSDAQ